MTMPSVLTSLYDELIDYLADTATPELILAFKPSEKIQQRAEELTDLNKAGTLPPDKADELEQMLQFERRLMALKARALMGRKQP